MTERELQRTIIRHARERGHLVCHFGNSVKYVRRGKDYKVVPDPDAAGFPDLVLVRDDVMRVSELKDEKGKVTEKQQQWLEAVAGVEHVTTHVWRPDDLDEVLGLLQ